MIIAYCLIINRKQLLLKYDLKTRNGSTQVVLINLAIAILKALPTTPNLGISKNDPSKYTVIKIIGDHFPF